MKMKENGNPPIPFLVEGFKRDEKCVYITDRHKSETIKELFMERGIRP